MTYIEFVNQKKSPYHPTPWLNVSVGEVHFAPSSTPQQCEALSTIQPFNHSTLQPINNAKHSQPFNHSTIQPFNQSTVQSTLNPSTIQPHPRQSSCPSPPRWACMALRGVARSFQGIFGSVCVQVPSASFRVVWVSVGIPIG